MKERYFVYAFKATKEQMDELENHLKMNGYDFLINGEKISIHEEETDYVETIMTDREIYFNLVDVEFR